MQQLADLRTSVRILHRCVAPPARVFDAWLTPPLAGLWLFATASRPMTNVTIDARNGGTFCMIERRAGASIEHRGRYIEILRPRRLVFELQSPDFACRTTRVSATFTPQGAGCELNLLHDAVPADRAMQVEARWAGMFYGLGMVLSGDSTEKYIN